MGPSNTIGVTVKRAEILQDGEPIFIAIGSVTVEEKDTQGTINVLSSKGPRLTGLSDAVMLFSRSSKNVARNHTISRR